jgi:surface carbohydrate biosynthesis protein
VTTTVNVVFPVETLVRELDFRLALAVKYLERHHRMFLGGSFATFRLLSNLNGGLYVGKNILLPWKNPYGPLAYDLAKARGFSVVHLSEEGAVFMGGDDYFRMSLDRELDPNTFKAEDFIATWGTWQADHYRSKGAPCTPHIRATGHPRFDLYRSAYRSVYQERVDSIRARFKDFVLINTNWQLALHPLGPDFCFSPVEGFVVEDDERREWFVALWSRVSRTVPAYVELIHKLSIRRKDLNFVFRPHPSDDPTLLRAAFRGVPNVHIVREGVVAPWILASRVMIHDGCTTGMEGYMLGQPVVSYQPVPEVETDSWLTNLFGVKCTTREEAIDIVLDAVNDPAKCAAAVRDTHIPEHAHEMFLNFRQESMPLLVDLMHEAEERAPRTNGGARVSAKLVAAEAKAGAVERAKRVVRPLFKMRQKSVKMARAAYWGLKRDDILPRLKVLETIHQKRVNCRFYSDDLIELTLA